MKILVEKAPYIEITLIDGDAIHKDAILKINAMGLINSWRDNSEDHYVYFGSAKEMNGKIVNDVICNKDDKFALMHFFIRYDKYKNCYFLKDLGDGTGTFLSA